MKGINNLEYFILGGLFFIGAVIGGIWSLSTIQF